MNAYTDWLASVKALLTHPDAINCTLYPDDRVLMAWHESGKSVEDTAKDLNERYRHGYNSESEIARTILAPTE